MWSARELKKCSPDPKTLNLIQGSFVERTKKFLARLATEFTDAQKWRLFEVRLGQCSWVGPRSHDFNERVLRVTIEVADLVGYGDVAVQCGS